MASVETTYGEPPFPHDHLVHTATAHDWEEEKRKQKDFFDDGTMTFFWFALYLSSFIVSQC